MTNRRNKPVNKVGCKPAEDVCVQHDEPLICRHGCTQASKHYCSEQTEEEENQDE